MITQRSTVLLIVLYLVSQLPAITIAADCNVVPIEQWGGGPSQRRTELKKPVNLVIIQHSVTKECMTDAECERLATGIRHYHITHGYDDIGMSFLVGGNGKIYEGAGWKVGAHTRSYNNMSISLSFLGDFREKLPTTEALQAAQKFLSCSAGNGDLGKDYQLVGHLQLLPTLSPGATLQSEIETWPHWLSDKQLQNNNR